MDLMKFDSVSYIKESFSQIQLAILLHPTHRSDIYINNYRSLPTRTCEHARGDCIVPVFMKLVLMDLHVLYLFAVDLLFT